MHPTVLAKGLALDARVEGAVDEVLLALHHGVLSGFGIDPDVGILKYRSKKLSAPGN